MDGINNLINKFSTEYTTAVVNLRGAKATLEEASRKVDRLEADLSHFESLLAGLSMAKATIAAPVDTDKNE